MKGLKNKAKKEEIKDIFDEHLVTILKLWSVGYYEEKYQHCFKLDIYEKPQILSSESANNLDFLHPALKKPEFHDKLI